MKRLKGPVLLSVSLVIVLAGLGAAVVLAQQPKPATPAWAINATIIEACSCSMFCPCYFSTKPSPEHEGHGGGEHYCQFNMGYHVNRGSYGTVKLDGIKFWIAGDLGDDFGDNQTEWAEVTFEPSVTKEQRDAVAGILLGPGHIYPWKWGSFTVGKDAPVEWKATKERAEARLDGGKAGEIILVHNPTSMTGDQTVIKNLKYFGAARNDGFILMPTESHAYRVGPKPFEFKGTNGFMITIDMNSKDVH
ncbi:MAG TPA: DUF1326 domain-containing protein [Candidatus Polarisedimenticolia bacterium]|nr:DUF1326 domain-containing protein [Candidatus Polarisedimenticolia bacterium]